MDEAVHHHRAALEENPKLADTHNNLGSALSRQGKLDESIRHLREALHFNPQHAEAHYNLANALYQQGQSEEAVRLYRMALAIKPDLAKSTGNQELASLRALLLSAAVPLSQLRPEEVASAGGADCAGYLPAGSPSANRLDDLEAAAHHFPVRSAK